MSAKLAEIAARIDAHLRRFEADPKINEPNPAQAMKIPPYYHAGAYEAGRYVGIQYISFQGHANITKAEAQAYLEWLDAGNVGKHYAFRRATATPPAANEH